MHTTNAHRSPIKAPSAWLPVAMSLTAFALVLWSVGIAGTVRETDEGASAHIWQLLMGGQLPVIAYFAATELRRNPKRAWPVVALQAAAALLAMAPVWLFDL